MKRAIPLVFALALGGCDELGDSAFEPYFGDDDSLQYASFGSVAISANDSDPVTIDVPEGASSFVVVMSGTGNVLTQPATITNPDGEVVFEVGVNNANRSDATPHVQTTLVPVNPGISPSPGEWQFVFFGAGSTNAEIEALVRIGNTGGALDLNLHFVGVDGLDAATARDDADFQAVLSDVASTYRAAGITIGETQYFDIDDDQYATLTTTQVGSDELLTLLEKHTSDRDNRAANIFFVADIENPGSARSLLGVSGGVPGPSAIHGTRRSGVAVNAANYSAALDGAGDLADAKAELALVIAHELGHYMGLFHTTEANGESLAGGLNGADPIDDSPVCADASDSNSDNTLSSDECASADGSNLMFWSPPNSARTLTSGQRTILGRNPLVR